MFVLQENRQIYASIHDNIYSPTIDAYFIIGDFVSVKSYANNQRCETVDVIGQIIDILPSNIVPQSEAGSFNYTYWNGILPNNYPLCLV